MSSFTPAGSGGLPLVISVDGISSYSVANVSVLTANNEVSIVVPGTAIWFSLSNRTDGTTKVAFVSGESSSNFATIWPGELREFRKINGAPLTLYVQCPKESQVLELVYGHTTI